MENKLEIVLDSSDEFCDDNYVYAMNDIFNFILHHLKNNNFHLNDGGNKHFNFSIKSEFESQYVIFSSEFADGKTNF